MPALTDTAFNLPIAHKVRLDKTTYGKNKFLKLKHKKEIIINSQNISERILQFRILVYRTNS